MKNNFAFSPEFVIVKAGYKLYNSGNKNELRTDCPVCGKPNAYMNKTKYAFHCFSCGTKGGILQFYKTAKKLSTNKEAFNELNKAFKQLSPEEKKMIEKQKAISVGNVTCSSSELLNKYNSNLLDSFTLSNEDKKELLSRGMTTAQIESLRFISVPVTLKSAAKKMLKEDYLPLCKTAIKRKSINIPGLFVKTNGEMECIYMARHPSGIMIPVIDRHGKVVMFQIRRHALPENATDIQKKKYHKYVQFSSGFKDSGCSTGGIKKIHHVGFNFNSDKTPNTVCITEGCLKADVSSCLDKKAYIAVLGVNNLNNMEEEIKYLIQHGTKVFRIRLDMDFMNNEAVSSAMVKLNEIFQTLGVISVAIKPNNKSCISCCWKAFAKAMRNKKLRFIQYADSIPKDKIIVYNDFWNPKFKGIDDYLLNKQLQQKQKEKGGRQL